MLLSVATIAATPVAAVQDFDMHAVAESLGTIIASEGACGLAYDQAAIADYIDAHVPPDAMEFPSYLDLMVRAGELTLEDQSPGARAAHCHAVERTARHYLFIE
jgi:hypothetical protein